MKRLLSLAISLILLIGLVYFSNGGEIVAVLYKTNFYYVMFGIALWFCSVLLRTLRWQYLLTHVGCNVGFFKTMKIFVAGLFLSNLTPAKSGEPIRSILLKKNYDKDVSTTLPSILVEKIVDIIILISISAVGVLLFETALVSKLLLWLPIAILIYITLFSVAIYIVISEKRTDSALGVFYNLLSFIPKIRNFVAEFRTVSKKLHRSFMKYKNKEILLATGLLSIIIWLTEGSILFIAFKAVGLQVTLLATVITISIAILIAVLTFLPGGLGSSEIILAMLLSSLFPLTLAEVTAAVLLARFLSFWMYALFGSIIFSTLKVV